jgi:hypothetical protein
VIRRLRRRHLIAGTTVLALAPLGVILGVLARAPTLAPPALPTIEPVRMLARVPGLRVELGRFDAIADSVVLFVRATAPLPWPDPLLYWSPAPLVGDSVPEEARFIGELSRRAARATFARGTFASGGTLLVVDGARGRAVATVPAPPALAAEGSR